MSVSVQVEDEIALVTIERERVRNALRLEDKRALTRALADMQSDARAVVVTGAGDRAFCAGTDIKEMAGMDVPAGIEMLQAEAELFEQVMNLPIPVVGAVRGAALGAGCVLVCCCDLVVADRTAFFSQPEVRNGVPAPVQAALLPRLVGLARARRMLYLGEVLDADAALAAGLISEVVDGDARARALELARTVARLPQQGFALQKRIVGSWIRDPFDASVESSVYVAASAFTSGEPQQAISAFLERR